MVELKEKRPVAAGDPVTWERLGQYCEGRKDDCHKLLAAQFQLAVNEALDKKLSEKAIIFMSKQNYYVTVALAIGTGLGGINVVKFLAGIAGIKVGP